MKGKGQSDPSAFSFPLCIIMRRKNMRDQRRLVVVLFEADSAENEVQTIYLGDGSPVLS
jgi:hypothetical protein